MPNTPSRQVAAVINIATAADHTIVAAVAAERIKVYAIWFRSAGTTVVTPKSGSTALAGPISLVAQSAFDKDPRSDDEPWFTCGINEAFVITNSLAIQVSGVCYYIQSA